MDRTFFIRINYGAFELWSIDENGNRMSHANDFSLENLLRTAPTFVGGPVEIPILLGSY